MDNIIVQFVRLFGKKYKWLYDHRSEGVKYYKDMEAFDKYGKDNEERRVFVERLAMARGDIFSSDREAVAFIRALRDMGGQEAFAGVTKQDWIDAVNTLNGIIPKEERIAYFNKLVA